MKASSSSQGCPYAAAFKLKQQEDQKQDGNTRLNNNDDDGVPVDQELVAELRELEVAKRKCPAFSGIRTSEQRDSSSSSPVSCPFSNAKTPEEIRETLLRLPPSHLEPEGLVFKSLEHFHSKRPSGSDSNSGQNSIFPGGCPVKNTILRDSDFAPISFHHAMEDYSLAAIMARMAKEFQPERHGEDASDSDDSSTSTSGSQHVEEDAIVDSNVSKKVPSNEGTVALTADAASTGDASSTASSVAVAAPPPLGLSPRQSLSDALKAGTAVSHEQAEHVHFVKNFIRGKIDRNLYAQLVIDLFHVYKTLEHALDEHAPIHFQICHFPNELSRTESLREDVDFWYTPALSSSIYQNGNVMEDGDEGKVSPPITPATRDYMDRIRYCAKHQPLLLLSHAYTRYLGDLSGGKILARVARRALHLEKDGEGLAFYQFDRIKSAKQFKDLYRNALNTLDLSETDITNLVREANIAFGLNVRLFEELDVQGGLPGASVRPLEDIITLFQDNNNILVDSQYDTKSYSKAFAKKRGGNGAKECPFAVGKAASQVAADHGSAPAPIFHRKSESDAVGKQRKTSSRCPWPFILLHDPAVGFRCWQTWLVLGLIVSWAYGQYLVSTGSSHSFNAMD